jgi:hypothetical protein
VGAGIFTGGAIDTVMVRGHGRAIFGDIIAENDEVNSAFGINRVAALDGARLDGTRNFFGESLIWCSHLDSVFTHGGIIGANINSVIADGTGAILDSLSIVANNISSIVATDSTDGFVNSTVFTVLGSLGRIAAGGPGMDNVFISIHGPARTIETTGPTSIMSNCDITVRGVLGNLSTNALAFDNIDILTIGRISTFDFIQGSTLKAGGLRTITVHNDIFDGSLIQVAGPLSLLNVGGDVSDSSIEATGQFGNIGNIIVKGGITHSEIFSAGSIAKIQVGGGIDADITTWAVTKHNPTTIVAGGAVSGDWQFANEIKSLKTSWLGNVNATIDAAAIGTITADGAINGNITTAGNAGKIIARGNIAGEISVGNNLGTLQSVEGSIRGDVVVTQRVGSVMAANDVGSITGLLHSVLTAGGPVGKILAGSGGTIGDVVADVSVFERVNSLQATGDITGIIDIGALGTMKATGAIAEDIDIAGKAGSIMSGGNLGQLGSHLNVGLDLGRLSVGTSSAPADNISDVGIGGKLGSLSVTGDMPGNLTVGHTTGRIAIGGDAGQSGQLWQIGASLGSMEVGKSGTLSDLIAAVDVFGNMGRLNVTGDLFDDFTVGHNVGTIDIGRVLGSPADLTLIDIGGSLNKITSGSVFVEVTPSFFNIFDSGIHTGDLTVAGTIKHPPL